MYREVVDAAKDKMQKTIHVFQSELRAIRAGRANPQLLERVMVDYYGTATPLTQMGNVSAPEPRMLLVSVWDQSALTLVEKAIQKSDLGMNPSNDGKVIRLIVPELTEERRKELTKVVAKTAEEAKVAIRAIRRDAMDHVKKQQKDSVITEDDLKVAEKKIQEATDGHVKTIDELAAAKDKEIMEV
jgi:ribosome recycling factor